MALYDDPATEYVEFHCLVGGRQPPNGFADKLRRSQGNVHGLAYSIDKAREVERELRIIELEEARPSGQLLLVNRK